MPTRYLFVCWGNMNRSPYAAEWFADYCKRNNTPAEIDSAGTQDISDYPVSIRLTIDGNQVNHPRKQLTSELLAWADVLVLMDNEIVEIVQQRYPLPQTSTQRKVNLEIPDFFSTSTPDPDSIRKMSEKDFADYFKRQGRAHFGSLVT